jgi:four helix bundle protein
MERKGAVSKVHHFEDLIAWQKAREPTREIYRVTSSGRLANDRGMVAQIRKVSTSIMANIAEGFERGRRTEFHQFLSVAKGSCAEVRSFLYVCLDAGALSREEFVRLHGLAVEVARIVSRLRSAVARQRETRR